MNTFNQNPISNKIVTNSDVGVVRVVNPLVILRVPVVLLVLGLAIINLLLS